MSLHVRSGAQHYQGQDNKRPSLQAHLPGLAHSKSGSLQHRGQARHALVLPLHILHQNEEGLERLTGIVHDRASSV